MNTALAFAEEHFAPGPDRIMGCQSAGAGFLRALVAGLPGETLYACAPHWQAAERFHELVTAIDPAANTGWIPPDRHDLLARVGTLTVPGPDLETPALSRLAHGAGDYSLVGVTHSLAEHGAMDAVTRLATAPVMPWDALVCTSRAALAVVEGLLREQGDYLRWRLGRADFPMPRLPVIPLGVHCDDFRFAGADRLAARQALGLADDTVAALYFGRLNFHAKAHPHALFAGLAEAVRRTGRAVTLVMCGIFPHATIEEALRDGAERFAPGVRVLFLDGREPAQVARAFAGADLFVSLADNIQETFGLAPLEAMAAGLPVVVTDWDGYRDTVRDGEDGFRIPTWMPPAPLGEFYAARYRTGMIQGNRYQGLTCQNVAVDRDALVEKLSALIANPDLRRDMGRAGQARARGEFDWAVIFGRYRELWAELAAIRARETAGGRPLPRVVPSRPDPFAAFAAYPTHCLQADTTIRRRQAATGWGELLEHPLFAYARESLPDANLAASILDCLSPETPITLADLAARSGLSLTTILFAASCLAKAGLVQLAQP